MPSYRTRTNKPKKRAQRKYAKRLPRDPKKLFRWAARGSPKDYDRLRQMARKARNSLPAHIDKEAYRRLEHIDRLRLIEEIQAHEQHDLSAGAFFDAVNWVLDKIPWGNWLWPVSAAQSAINSQKGDGLNEVDEQYARLVGATYGGVDNRPYVIDHWKRQVAFDSEYVSVWDNPDGHRLIAVRGTEGSADIAEDILVGFTGNATNRLGGELLQILAATPQGTVVDLASHSLGTSLALESYSNATIYNKIHETYLFNPAYSPFMRGKTDAYEKDSSVRYFINVRDLVSMGGSAHKAPRNVVYRSDGIAASAHNLAQWQGAGAYQDPIYHAPPETQVHARKQALQLTKHEESPEHDDLEPTETSVLHDQGRSEPGPAFDFGAESTYDFGAL
jgi:hypothetical protein